MAYVPVQVISLSQPQAIEGVLDLRQWDFAQAGPINLDGEWKFYWQQSLTNGEIAGTTPPRMTGYISVPGSWRGYKVNGQPLSGDGYATYRLTILINPATLPEEFLALKMPVPVNTAHRLYVDGQLLGSAGQVGSTAETMTPQYDPYRLLPSGAVFLRRRDKSPLYFGDRQTRLLVIYSRSNL